MINSPFISERFEKAVSLHIVKNVLWKQTDPPLFLGIEGQPGYGKTFQLEFVLDKIGVQPFRISAGQLESRNAGEPAQLIRTNYLRSCG